MTQNQGKYTLRLLFMCLYVGVAGDSCGFWKLLWQGENGLTWEGLALGWTEEVGKNCVLLFQMLMAQVLAFLKNVSCF